MGWACVFHKNENCAGLGVGESGLEPAWNMRAHRAGEGTSALRETPSLPPWHPPLDGNAAPKPPHLGAFLCDLGTGVLIRVSGTAWEGRKAGSGHAG